MELSQTALYSQDPTIIPADSKSKHSRVNICLPGQISSKTLSEFFVRAYMFYIYMGLFMYILTPAPHRAAVSL